VWLEIDGGIKASNIGRVVAAGADTFVAGSSIFDGTDLIAENVVALRQAASVLAGSDRSNSPKMG